MVLMVVVEAREASIPVLGVQEEDSPVSQDEVVA